MAESTAEFTIQDIDSEDDVREIEAELDDLEGVMGIRIDQETGAAEIHYDADLLSGERIEITVRDQGYEVEDGDDE